MREPIEHLCRQIDYTFTKSHLIEQALTHRSAGNENNERFEYLGDSILGFVIADELFQRFQEADEGQLSRLRAKLVKKESLASIARELNLGTYLMLGPGELRSGGQSRDSILADALEALIAAVYLDNGYQASRALILNLFENRLSALSPNAPQKDPKTRLQEFLQSKRLPLPTYVVTEISGEQHDQSFMVSCTVESLQRRTVGAGSSRRRAEQDAAKKLLDELKHV